MKTRHPIPHSLTACTTKKQWKARKAVLKKQQMEASREWMRLSNKLDVLERHMDKIAERREECERRIKAGDKGDTPCP